MSEETSFAQYTPQAQKPVRKSHFVAIFFVILFIVIVILVGLYFLGASKKGSTPTLSSRPTVTIVHSPTPAVTATPTPVVLKRSELTIAVLNGSGIAGAAKNISTKLSDLGYTVKTVGNAKQFDYQDITILITEEKKAYLDLLQKDLTDEGISIETEITDDLTVDAEVIVGK